MLRYCTVVLIKVGLFHLQRHLSRLKANGGLLFSPEVLCSLSTLVPTEANAFWDTEWTELNSNKGKTPHHLDESQSISKLTVKFILRLYSRFREATERIFPQGRLFLLNRCFTEMCDASTKLCSIFLPFFPPINRSYSNQLHIETEALTPLGISLLLILVEMEE